MLQVYVEVENINDNVPLSLEPVYYSHIMENSPPDTPIVQVIAYDSDGQASPNITYTISAGNADELFKIHKTTGTQDASIFLRK